MKIKFSDVPLGGRVFIAGSVWIVLERHGYGKLAKETLNPHEKHFQSICCFFDEEDGMTLDSEVEFIGLEAR